jgi:hypothetical protein
MVYLLTLWKTCGSFYSNCKISMSMSTSLQFKIKLCNIQQQITTSRKRWWKLLFNHNSWNVFFKMSNAFFMTFLLLERSLLKITPKIVCILFVDYLWRIMNESKSEHPLSPMKHRWISILKSMLRNWKCLQRLLFDIRRHLQNS